MSFVYHGTSAENMDNILNEGILPRKKTDNSNWSQSEFNSLPKHVYLTDIYGIFFGMCAAEETENISIIEIDMDRLDESLLYPDEDFIEQSIRQNTIEPVWEDNNSISIVERTRLVRKNISDYKHLWEDSLNGIGNISYKSRIPTEAIRRVSTINREDAPNEFFLQIDPTITIQNALFAGNKYRFLTEVIFGKEVTVKDVIIGLNFPHINPLDIPDDQLDEINSIVHEDSPIYNQQKPIARKIIEGDFWDVQQNSDY